MESDNFWQRGYYFKLAKNQSIEVYSRNSAEEIKGDDPCIVTLIPVFLAGALLGWKYKERPDLLFFSILDAVNSLYEDIT